MERQKKVAPIAPARKKPIHNNPKNDSNSLKNKRKKTLSGCNSCGKRKRK